MVDTHSTQAPRTVVMVRPHHFFPNAMTAQDNAFQHPIDDGERARVGRAAHDEVTLVAKTLEGLGVEVCLFEDDTTQTPDSVFPNNWFSTHADGRLALYPMYAENRRGERRADIIDYLQVKFHITEIVDFSELETHDLYLEGTGSMVLDHRSKRAYAALSNRTHKVLFDTWCDAFGYAPIAIDAHDAAGMPIYHTNVMMCVGHDYALVGLDTIIDPHQKRLVIDSLEGSGREIIALDMPQIGQFAGNAFELEGREGRLLAMSQTAFNALTAAQIEQLEQYVTIVPMAIPTLESAGGSIRCMLAGIHCPPKTDAVSHPP